MAAAIVSRCLGWHPRVDQTRILAREAIRKSLSIDEDTCPLKSRNVRDAFEHIDERIESLASSGRSYVDLNISFGNTLGGLSTGVDPLRHTDLDQRQLMAKDQNGTRVSIDYGAVVTEASRLLAEAKRALKDAELASNPNARWVDEP